MRTLKITFTVDEMSAGSVLADLGDRVQNLDFHVIEEVPHTKNKPRRVTKANGSSITDVIMAVLHEEGTCSLDDMRKALKKHGFSEGSLNGRLHSLLLGDHVKRTGPNQYAIGSAS